MCCPKLEKNINQSSLLTPLCQPLQYNTSKTIDETVKILFFKYFFNTVCLTKINTNYIAVYTSTKWLFFCISFAAARFFNLSIVFLIHLHTKHIVSSKDNL